MGDSNRTTTSNGIGCVGYFAVLLQVLFIGLQLTGYVEWEWWQVWSPSLLYSMCVASLIVGILLGALIYVLVDAWLKK